MSFKISFLVLAVGFCFWQTGSRANMPDWRLRKWAEKWNVIWRRCVSRGKETSTWDRATGSSRPRPAGTKSALARALHCAAAPAAPAAAAGNCSCGLRRREAAAVEPGLRQSCRPRMTTESPGSGSRENPTEPDGDSWSSSGDKSRPGRDDNEFRVSSARITKQCKFSI